VTDEALSPGLIGGWCREETRATRNALTLATEAEPSGVRSAMILDMEDSMILALTRRRGEIHRRWDALLHLERAATPLADPDLLARLINWTLDKVFDKLRGLRARRRGKRPPNFAELGARCHCGQNPFLLYFLAGEQALLEGLVLSQNEDPLLKPAHRDTAVAELYLVINEIAATEIESLCSLCRNHRGPEKAAPLRPIRRGIGLPPRGGFARGRRMAPHPLCGGRPD
jgi:hypothetical protein